MAVDLSSSVERSKIESNESILSDLSRRGLAVISFAPRHPPRHPHAAIRSRHSRPFDDGRRRREGGNGTSDDRPGRL